MVVQLKLGSTLKYYYFIKKDDPGLAKPPLNFNFKLAQPELTTSVK